MMPTREHCENTSPDTGSQNMSTDTTHESAAANTENIDMSFDKLTKASVDSTSDTLTLASMDSTSDTLTLAIVDNTSDTLTLANMDNTSDTLTLANMDNTSDTLTLAIVDNTSDTLTLANMDNTSDTLTLANMDNTSDTLTLAKLDRENQGLWEAEYSYEGEADLHQHYSNCTKNPGHKNFIPVDKFSIEDLPEDYRDNYIVDYIRAVSELTVRVAVNYVSDSRPATAPVSRKPYPGYSVKGRRRMTVGTGWVNSVYVTNDTKGDTCKCKECQNSSEPMRNFARIQILTAAHVVFDDLEGEHTTCHLFFDRGNTLGKCNGVVTLTGMSFVSCNVSNDICDMSHYIHDLDLARRLDQTIKLIPKLKAIIRTKLPQICKFKQRRDVLDRQPLLFIVSHPHGCSKQVCLGRWTSTDMISNDIISLLYTASTCPGSSGAQVRVVQEFLDPESDGRLSSFYGVHCGASDAQLDLNFCRSHGDFPASTLVSVDMLQLGEGLSEDALCYVMDDGHIQHYAACKKNPEHRYFYPVEKFSMDNLPSSYRRDDLKSLIKCVSDLTVRVSVKYVSEARPETVPGTDIPWIRNSGSEMTRAGSGFIDYSVIRSDEDCPCKECKNSKTPQKFACISINTSAHLVYDELEAEHTTCHLFFDSGETSGVCKDAVTLTDMSAFYKYTELDSCRLEYCTHDLELAWRLGNMIHEYLRIHLSLNRNDDVKSTKYVKQNGRDSPTQETPLHIVVSHPHGCAKQVSIGYCDSPGTADTEGSQCSHTSVACPGSSGAPVIVAAQFIYPCL